jgi:flagellar capping protein FliD
MSDIYVPGIKSRFDTDKMIQDLMRIERIPKERSEKNVENLQAQKNYWQDLGRRISALRDSARFLYSFQNPFNDRIVRSSDPLAISGISTREATEQEHSFVVKQIAQADRFLSDPLEDSFKVDEGKYTFSVGQDAVSFAFPGGSLREFTESLNRRGQDKVSSSLIAVQPGKKSLLVESRITGEENRLIFSDAAEDLGVHTGILGELTGSTPIPLKEEVLKVEAGGTAFIPFNLKGVSAQTALLEFEIATEVRPTENQPAQEVREELSRQQETEQEPQTQPEVQKLQDLFGGFISGVEKTKEAILNLDAQIEKAKSTNDPKLGQLYYAREKLKISSAGFEQDFANVLKNPKVQHLTEKQASGCSLSKGEEQYISQLDLLNDALNKNTTALLEGAQSGNTEEIINPALQVSQNITDFHKLAGGEVEESQELSETQEELPSTSIPARTPLEPLRRVDDMHVLYLTFSDGTNRALPPIKDSTNFSSYQYQFFDIAGDKTVVSMEIANQNTHRDVSIRNIQILDPTVVEGEIGARNPVSVAQDAIVTLEGIEIKRPTNTINDLIPGITIIAKTPTDKPIQIAVEPDREAIKNAIITFVGNYNRLMAEINVLTRNDDRVIQELSYLSVEEQADLRKRMGVFVGDSILGQFKNTLQRLATASYPTSAEGDLAMLAQIGISTDVRGSGGSGYDPSRLRGYLEIDEKALDAALETNLAAIQQLFGYDTNGDFVVDTGVAYTIETLAKPYMEIGGIIALKTGTIDSRINQEHRRMEALDKQLAAKESALKSQYGQMEGAYSRMERMSTSIDQFSQQSSNNRR